MMKNLLILILAFITVNSHSMQAQTDKFKNLNGKTFTIHLNKTSGPQAGFQWTTDEIMFKSDFLKSKVMSARERFIPAEVTIIYDASSPATAFEATSKNLSKSTIKWKGTVNGNSINGTAEWTNSQGKQVYSFTGSLKGSKK